jgi:hypothetical protein
MTFTTQEVDDLLNYGMVEVTRVYPKERIDVLNVTVDGQSAYIPGAESIFRVEVMEEGKPPRGIPQNSQPDDAQGGWDFHAGSLYLPYGVTVSLVAGIHTIRIWGYWQRELMYGDNDVMDGDAETEYAVRTVATLNGYQRLQNDRLLFQQWLTNTGNTDVSPNQLAQTADLYQSQWREMRMRLRTLQRM